MVLLSVLPACFAAAVLAGNDITGLALNLSRGEPAAGDEVVLLRLDQGMQQEARSESDAQGRFAFHVQYPDKLYLVRVIHQGVNYDQQVRTGDRVSIDVFDAARKVQRITGSIEILRTGTNGSLLHVSDMYEIENGSRPPLTLASEHTLEVYLPVDAKIDSVLAAGPGNIVVMISATPLPGEPGHYTVNFPLRPGATKFAFNYDLAYQGHTTFQTRRAYPVHQLAVMIPPTMAFSSRPTAFQILPTGSASYQVHVTNHLKAGEGPWFEVSGTGVFPPIGEQPKSLASSPSTGSSTPKVVVQDRAIPPSLAPIDSRLEQAQASSQSLVLAGVATILLGVCVLLVWHARKS